MKCHVKAVPGGSIDAGGRGRFRSLLAILALALCAAGSSASSASAAQATATINTVEDVSYTSAQIKGEVGPTDPGRETFWAFQYSTDGVNWSDGPGSGPEAFTRYIPPEQPATPVETTLTGLKPAAQYFVRLTTIDFTDFVEVSSPEPYQSFTTDPVAKPTVLIDPVTTFTGTTAKFTGTIEPGSPAGNPAAFDVSWEFRCTPDCPELKGSIPADSSTPSVEVAAEATGLEPNTTYQAELVASNAGGSESDGPQSFETLAIAPEAQTIPAFALGGGTEALIGGKVNPENLPTTYWLEYGPGPGGPGATYTDNAPATKDAVVPLQATGTGDLESDPEHGPRTVSNVVTATGAFAVGQRITGTGIPPLTTITGVLPHGLTLSNPATATADGVSLTATGVHVVSLKISGLTPTSTYHFRVVAKNASGTTQGEDLSFQTLALPTPPPSSCPNDKLRAETSSGALGECRAYEMTSAPDKNGGDVGAVLTSSPDGDRLGYISPVAFSDPKANAIIGSYLGQRTATGWVSRSIGVPLAVPSLATRGQQPPVDFTADLSKAIVLSPGGVASEPEKLNLFLAGIDGSTSWLTSPTVAISPVDNPLAEKTYAGRSADGSHIFFESTQSFTDQGNGASQVWEWFNGQVRLASILPGGGVPPQGASLGNNDGGRGGIFFAGTLVRPTVVSEDGSRVFFGLGSGGQSLGIFVRENGTETRRLDLSQRIGTIGEPPPFDPGRFVGAAADGSIVVFSSLERLSDDATFEGGLYAYDLESEELRFLSAGATDPAGAQVEGVSQISKDGSHVYFAARSILVPGEGVADAHNLYVADDSGIHFIATLGDDDEGVWSESFHNAQRISAQATPDGRYFVFPSYERLTAFDNDGRAEIYRFDADTGAIICVSCASEGGPASGDASILPRPLSRGGSSSVTPYGRPAAITPDGSRVLFESTEGLVPGDVNDREDIYLYRDGQLSLVSTGTSKYDSDVGGITPDGGNVFFTTRDSIVGQDIDGGGRDVYDARINGGFPSPAPANACESADACQDTPAPPPSFAAPASIAPGRGNPKSRPRRPCIHKAKKNKKARCARKAKGHHRKHKRNASSTGRTK